MTGVRTLRPRLVRSDGGAIALAVGVRGVLPGRMQMNALSIATYLGPWLRPSKK